MNRSDFRLPPLVSTADWLLLGTVLTVSVLFYGFRMFGGESGGPLTTVIRVGDERVAELPAGTDTALVIEGRLGRLKILQRGGEVWFEDAPCRLKICERTGHIARAGEIIVCAPSRVMARLESAAGGESGGLDAISR